MAQHNEFGKEGEELAASFLSRKGYQLLERNYRHKKAEIDLIALHGNVLAIVEVKSRNHNAIENPKDAITPRKIRNIVAAAHEFVVEKGLDVEVRFDVIAIIKKEERYTVEHVENAFYHF